MKSSLLHINVRSLLFFSENKIGKIPYSTNAISIFFKRGEKTRKKEHEIQENGIHLFIILKTMMGQITFYVHKKTSSS